MPYIAALAPMPFLSIWLQECALISKIVDKVLKILFCSPSAFVKGWHSLTGRETDGTHL